MRYWLGQYEARTVDGGSFFVPEGVGAAFSSIDLRPDPRALSGACLVAVPDGTPIPTHAVDLGDGGKISALMRTRIGNALGVSVASADVGALLGELLVAQAREDGSRWRPLRAMADGVFRAKLGDLSWKMAGIGGGSAITESFNTADGPTLGPDLSWTELAGTWDIVSNKARRSDVPGAGAHRSARADVDLATSNLYAQVDATWVAIAADAGAAVRFSSSAATFYSFTGNANADRVDIYKVVASSATSLATTARTIGAETLTMRVEVEGSNLRGLVGGVEALTVTDTAISGNTRAGLHGFARAVASTSHDFDNFQAGDIYRSLVVGPQRRVFGALVGR
jgi:hypothetical protein